MDKKRKGILEKVGESLSRPLSEKDVNVGRFFFLQAAIDVVIKPTGLVVDSSVADLVIKFLRYMRVRFSRPVVDRQNPEATWIPCNVRLLIDLLWGVSAFVDTQIVNLQLVDLDFADELVRTRCLRFRNELTLTHRFYASVVLQRILVNKQLVVEDVADVLESLALAKGLKKLIVEEA